MADLECPNCGGTNWKRNVTQGGGANRTKNRLVGGQSRPIERECINCGHTVHGGAGA